MATIVRNLWKKVRWPFLYTPEGTNELLKSASVNAQGPYRTPSPGTMEQPKLPNFENSDRMYNNNFYVRDTTSNPEPPIVGIVRTDANKFIVQAPLKMVTQGSPGNKNPDVLVYDPTGLRATMTTTQDALTESLAKYAPNHQPTPIWAADAQSIIDDCEAKGLPAVPGRQCAWEVEPHENKSHAW
jgi:hypothetical protein